MPRIEFSGKVCLRQYMQDRSNKNKSCMRVDWNGLYITIQTFSGAGCIRKVDSAIQRIEIFFKLSKIVHLLA